MQGNIGNAIAALKLATECGGELDAHHYAAALRGLVELRKSVLEYDGKLNQEERVPTGDDYNHLLSLLGLAPCAADSETGCAPQPATITSGQVHTFSDRKERERYEDRLTEVISAAMEHDKSLREEAILHGRFGLREMDDASLLTLGGESWNVYP